MKNILLKTVLSLAINSFVISTEAMNTKLEKVYLLNAVLYIDNGKDLLTFATINKKCRDVLAMKKRHAVNKDDNISIKMADAPNINTLDFVGENSVFDTARALTGLKNKSNITALTISGDVFDIHTKKDLTNLIEILQNSGFNKIFRIHLCGFDYEDLIEIIYEYDDDDDYYGYPTDVEESDIFSPFTLNNEEYKIKFSLKLDAADLFSASSTLDLNSYDVENLLLLKIINLIGRKPNAKLHMNWLDKREYDIMHEKGLDDKVAVKKIACLEINDIDEIGAFVNEMYNKRYANAVQIDARGAKFTYQELINSKMIEVNELGSIGLIKWHGPINCNATKSVPVSAEEVLRRFQEHNYVDNIIIDFTNFNDYNAIKRIMKSCYSYTYIRRIGDNMYALGGSTWYLPSDVQLAPDFFDAFFSYSNSEIILDNRYGYTGRELHRDIGGHAKLTTETHQTCINDFIKRTTNYNINKIVKNQFSIKTNTRPRRIIIGALDTKHELRNNEDILSAINKINRDELTYCDIDLYFADFANDSKSVQSAIEQYKLERLAGDGKTLKLQHRSSNNTFKYKHTTVLDYAPNGNIINRPVFQLVGVHDDVYSAPSKRLVIHKSVDQINFTPKPNEGLTFVLPPNVNYINVDFWQYGNSYILNAIKDQGTLNYLQNIKGRHDINITEEPDDFFYWHITKN